MALAAPHSAQHPVHSWADAAEHRRTTRRRRRPGSSRPRPSPAGSPTSLMPPAARAGHMRSTWPRTWVARSPTGQPPACRSALELNASHRSRRSRTSTSTKHLQLQGRQRRSARPARSRQDPISDRCGLHGSLRHRGRLAHATAGRAAEKPSRDRAPQAAPLQTLLIIDEVGYIPIDSDAPNLFFQLVAYRYEQGSILETSRMPVGQWGEILADDIVAATMVDRLVHHAEVLTLDGQSYRTKTRRHLISAQANNQRGQFHPPLIAGMKAPELAQPTGHQMLSQSRTCTHR